MDYNFIFAVSELLLFYESVSDFDGDGVCDDDGDEDGDDKSRGCWSACPCWRAVSSA